MRAPPEVALRVRGSFNAPALAGDLFGGVTTAAVALPVALGFGVASGLGPLAGLYGAVTVGFFAAVFGGAPRRCRAPPHRWPSPWRSW